MRLLRKVLAGKEDLLWGKTPVNQLRGDTTVPVTPLNLIHGVSSISELKALDTTKYYFAVSYSSPDLNIYAFDPNEVAPADDITYFAPNTGSGRWIKRTL